MEIKGTPTPWNYSLNKDNRVISIHTGETSNEIEQGKDVWKDPNIAGIWYDDLETSLADAAVISATPEAIEFISDLMEFFDFLELCQTDKINIEPWRKKAEIILKKAYNF